MAIILSLFSDAEMTGADSGACHPAASVCAADSVAVPNESAPSADAQMSLSDEWVQGFHPNHIEERERLGTDCRWCVNPCIHCQYRGLCDDDECAMKCFPLDMRHAPTARGWRNFGL